MTDEQALAMVMCELAGGRNGLQAVEGEFHRLSMLRMLRFSYDVQLDGVGIILGLPRGGLDDEEYRTALAVKAAANASRGEIDQILEAALLIDGVTDAQLDEIFPKLVELYLHGEMGTVTLRSLLKGMPKEGTGMLLISSDSEYPFVFGSDGGEWYVSALSGTSCTGEGDGTDVFVAGEEIRIWRLHAEEVCFQTFVVSSSLDGSGDTVIVMADSFDGIAYRDPQNRLMVERVDAGLPDPDGYGFAEAHAMVASDTANREFTVASSNRMFALAQRIELIGHGDSRMNQIYHLRGVVHDGGQTKLQVCETLTSGISGGAIIIREPSDPTDAESLEGEFCDEFESPA